MLGAASRLDATRIMRSPNKSGVDSPVRLWFYHAPFAGKFMYAVLETGSKQYRVAAGDTVEIERLAVEAGKPVTFDRVLLVNRDGKVAVGTPTVAAPASWPMW